MSSFRWTFPTPPERGHYVLRRKITLRTLAALLILPLGGWLYEQAAESRDARRFPPPGALVDIGGRRLHLLCIGSGRPIVFFEASGFSNSVSTPAARASLATRTTVCSYDRAGVGWSDPAPAVISVGELSEDLRKLQERAGLEPPFVIVTSSMGGPVSEMFARRYPDRVAGLVFVDAGNSDLLAIANSLHTGALFEVAIACVAVNAAGRTGLVRMIDPFAFDGFPSGPSAAAKRSAALMYGAQPWRAICAGVRGIGKSLEEFARAPPLRSDVPLVALSAERSDGLSAGVLPASWQQDTVAALQGYLKVTGQHLAQRSSLGSWRLIRDSGHLIAGDKPQAVVDAVLEVLAAESAQRKAQSSK